MYLLLSVMPCHLGLSTSYYFIPLKPPFPPAEKLLCTMATPATQELGIEKMAVLLYIYNAILHVYSDVNHTGFGRRRSPESVLVKTLDLDSRRDELTLHLWVTVIRRP